MGVKDFLEMTDEERFQVYLDLKGKLEHLRPRYERAMRVEHRTRPGLLLAMIEEYLERFEERHGGMEPAPLPPPKPKSGLHASFKRGAAVKGQGRS